MEVLNGKMIAVFMMMLLVFVAALREAYGMFLDYKRDRLEQKRQIKDRENWIY
jgi:hypothetical protein